jgi:CHAD domain-containing protein
VAFRLNKQDRDLTRLLRRVAAEELGAALAHAPGAEGAVHDSRKRVKKVRALLRLVQSGLPGAGAASRALGAAAGQLSAARDAEVMLATHDRLAPDLSEGPLRAHLAACLTAAQGDPAQSRRGAEFRKVLADVRVQAEHWRVRGDDAGVLRTGLARTRRRGLHAMAAAADDREGEPMHDWRKRVKDLWYQSRLLAPVWPAIMDPLGDQAGDLGEMLGDHHDLIVFGALLDALPDALADALAAPAADLRSRAARARGAIEARAFPLGRLLLSGEPDAVARLWADWWQAWRNR